MLDKGYTFRLTKRNMEPKTVSIEGAVLHTRGLCLALGLTYWLKSDPAAFVRHSQ